MIEVEGVYLTWLISALAIGVAIMPIVKPPWARISISGFVDFIRRYWLHVLILFSIYNAKDFLDQVDRIIMANTGLDMTPWIFAIEGSMVLSIQKLFLNSTLTFLLTHFYVVGFMVICYVSIFYFAYFDDRWMSDRITLTIFWVYLLAVPFYLFFNVRVTGDFIPEMVPLAYNLTPEINDWFTRIDPFTNGMPSLHIAFPFSVWLCLMRYDQDKRWERYRKIVAIFTLLTAFSIIYLGIHWFSDIIGGMVVAVLAVHLSEKSQFVWNYLDERTINSRISALLSNPNKSFAIIKNKIKQSSLKFKKPGSSETTALIIGLLFVVGATVTWDLTHQALPAKGVELPVEVKASGEWMVTLDNHTDGVRLIVHEISNLENEIEVIQPNLDDKSHYDLSGGTLAVANTTELFVVNLTNPSISLLKLSIANVDELHIVESSNGPVIAVVSGGSVELYSISGQNVDANWWADDNVTMLDSIGDDIVYVTEGNPTELRFAQIGNEGSIAQKLNFTASEIENEILTSWGLSVDEANATISDISITRTHAAVSVDVNATTRLVLLDRYTGESHIVGDPKYPVFTPHLDHGLLVWAAQNHFNPSNPIEKYSDKEILMLDISTNRTELLTSDEIEQWAPMALENHIIFSQANQDGTTSVEVLNRNAQLQPYSSIVLQTSVILMLGLIFLNIVQRQLEYRRDNISEEE